MICKRSGNKPLTIHYQIENNLWHEIWNITYIQKRFGIYKHLNYLIMNKITLFVTGLMLVATATKASEIINFSDTNLEFTTRFNADEPIQFTERGIDFFVFQNGEFDFNTRPNANDGDYYFKTAGRRSAEVNGRGLENFGVRIERDNFGRIRRIGNTFINYDFQDRVSRIGTIFLKYNRFALIQIGGLKLVYNRFGELINTFGNVKSSRNYGFTNGNHSYYGNGNHYDNYNNSDNDFQQDIDNQQNSNDHYYYRDNGTKAKIEEKKK